MAATMGLLEVVLETDATLVKMALDGDDYRLLALGGIITEIRLLLLSEFSSYSISVCPRDLDCVIRLLTDLQHLDVVFPLSSDDHVTWHDAPLFVEDLVASDLSE